MNNDVAEVNGSNPPMLPGSFLYEKEPGYEATSSPGHSQILSAAMEKNREKAWDYCYVNSWKWWTRIVQTESTISGL